MTFKTSFEFADDTETMIELTAEFGDASFDHAFGTEHIPLALDNITFDEFPYTPAQCAEIQTAIDNGRFDDDAWEALPEALAEADADRAYEQYKDRAMLSNE